MRINEKQVYKRYAYFRAKIQRDLIEVFDLDIEAEKISVLVGFHALQINKFYKLFRERIVELFEAESLFENGEIELDESYFDGFRAYDGLVNYGFKKHFRVSHSDNEFTLGRNHINGIENFW